jgi:hypothetical protein
MQIRDHLSKAEAFERSLAKLEPTEDGALYAVFLMRAATNRVNAALHALGVTSVGAATPAKLGDLNHTYKPKLITPVPDELRAAFKHLAFIEDLRPDYVRGPMPIDDAMVATCRTAYAAIRRETDTILARERS